MQASGLQTYWGSKKYNGHKTELKWVFSFPTEDLKRKERIMVKICLTSGKADRVKEKQEAENWDLPEALTHTTAFSQAGETAFVPSWTSRPQMTDI